MFYWLLYFFVALGAKLLLGLIMIYFLLPAEPSCNQCDGETILLQTRRAAKLVALACFGTLQRRWCPRCGWEGFARAPAAHDRFTLRIGSRSGSERSRQ
jgi:hypothetical protein